MIHPFKELKFDSALATIALRNLNKYERGGRNLPPREDSFEASVSTTVIQKLTNSEPFGKFEL